MRRIRRWRLLAPLGLVAIALAAVPLALAVSGDARTSDVGPLAADPGPDSTDRSSTSTSPPPSSSTSTTLPSSSSATASVSTTTTVAPARSASPEPTIGTTLATTSTTAQAAATTSTTAPATAKTAANCPDPGASSDFAGFAAGVVEIENDRGVHRNCMLIADTPERRRRGLMDQDDLDGYAGMAFLFEDEDERSFWMHRTRIPLSIAFFDAEGRFVSSRDMEPCPDGSDCPTYSSDGPAQFAIEVPQGQLPSVGATPGSRFEP